MSEYEDPSRPPAATEVLTVNPTALYLGISPPDIPSPVVGPATDDPPDTDPCMVLPVGHDPSPAAGLPPPVDADPSTAPIEDTLTNIVLPLGYPVLRNVALEARDNRRPDPPDETPS